MWKGNHLKDWRIHGECSAGLVDEFFAVGGGTPAKDTLKVLTPYGYIKTCSASSADAVRALNKERQKWQDAALSGGLPEVLPRNITPETIVHVAEKAKNSNLISLLDELPGPALGGKYAEMAAVGLLDDFENTVVQSWLEKRTFYDVDWWVITDDADTWMQLEFHAPFFSQLDIPDRERLDMMQAMVSPSLIVQSECKNNVVVEDMVHHPFMGVGFAEEGEQPNVEPYSHDKSVEEWIAQGEIVIPIMPVDLDEWRKIRGDTESVRKNDAESLEESRFSLERERFLQLILLHQKACNRFAYALWALNWSKEGEKG